MDKHWSHYCTTSIVHFMAFPETSGGAGPVVESIARVAADDFFDGIEIAWIKDPAARQEAAAVLAASGLRVGFCAHPAILSQKASQDHLAVTRRQACASHCRRVASGPR